MNGLYVFAGIVALCVFLYLRRRFQEYRDLIELHEEYYDY